ncbi:MAG: CDP-diacylglycerol--serine O-phosphatidyltransferase [Deltaproteobacteria bacterium]|jgi:CDP-diacylglycerol--serine O-phosphatidyltransferase|nr:CDP-diacylglycerol--serine O-phosphatidyltransferase [Deltaproteobacteria bacterium]
MIKRLPHKRKNRQKTRRTIYVLPNLITALSLFAGFYGLISAINGRFMAASAAILVAAILDSLDGTVARVTNTTSFFGREYDSLCDLIAFGAAPAILMYQWILKPGKLHVFSALSGETKTMSLGLVVAFIYLACGSLRLARFNISTGQRDPGFFQGIPITGGAVILSSAVFWHYRTVPAATPNSIFILILVLVTAFLMVSTFDYISLKHRIVTKNPHPFETLVLAVLILGILVVKAKTVLLPLCIVYMCTGPIVTLIRRKNLPEGDLAPGAQGTLGEPQEKATEGKPTSGEDGEARPSP